VKPIYRMLPVAVALASLVALSLPAAGDPLTLGTTTVSGNIDEYCEVQFNPHIDTWGRGHTPYGLPGSGNGADPQFVGGAPDDPWPIGGARKYCNGAVGRTHLWVWANKAATVRIVNPELPLVDGTGRQVAATGWIGQEVGGVIDIKTEWSLPRRHGHPEHCEHQPDCTYQLYLYCCVQRQGLKDVASSYNGIITAQIGPGDDGHCH